MKFISVRSLVRGAVGTLLFLLASSMVGCIGVLPIGGQGSLSTQSGAATVTGSGTGTTGGQAAQLMVNGAQTESAGTCYPYIVTALDVNGIPALSLGSSTPIYITGITNGQSYSDENCSVPAASAAMSENTTEFWVKSTQVGNFTLAVTASFGSGQLPISVVAGNAAAVSLTGPGMFSSFSCAPFNVAIVDNQTVPNDTIANSDRFVSLTLSGVASTNAEFFSDSGCSLQSPTAKIPAGSSSANFWLLTPTIGPISIDASVLNLSPGQLNANVVQGTTPSLSFVAPSTGLSGACLPAMVQVQQTGNSAFVAPYAVGINLVTRSSVKYYAASDSGCVASPIKSLSIAEGTASAPFYFKDTQAEVATTFAISSVFQSGKFTTQFSVNNLAQIAIEVKFSSIPATICGGATANLFDRNANPTVAGQTMSFPLVATGTSAPGTRFFSDNLCSTAPITSVTLKATDTSGSFYFTSPTPGNLVLSVTPPASVLVSPASFIVGDAPETPSVLTMSGPNVITTDQCNQYFVSATDGKGNPINLLPNDLVFTLGPVGGKVSFWSDGGCKTTPEQQITIAQGNSQASFYMKSTGVGNFTLSATSANNLSATEAITSNPGAAVGFGISLPVSLPVGICGHGNVFLVDQYQNPTSSSGMIPVNLAGSLSNSSESLSFFSGNTCLTPASNVSVGAGNVGNFSFSAPLSGGTATIVASSSGYHSATGTVTISAETQYHLSLTETNPLLNPIPFTAGKCVEFSVSIVDSNNNPAPIAPTVVSLSAGGQYAHLLFSDANCTAKITSVNLDSNSNPQHLYFEDTLASMSVTISANTISGLSDQVTVGVVAGPAYQLVFTAGVASIYDKTCTGGYTVGVQDSYGNATTTSIPVALSSSQAGLVFGEESCSSPVTSVSLASGSQNLSIQSPAPSSDAIFLYANAPGLQSANYQLTVKQLPMPNFQLGSMSLSFGGVNENTASTQMVTITNSGTVAGNVTSLVFSNPAYTQVVDNTSCSSSFSLSSGSSCTLKVQFKPTAIGADTASLTINNSGSSALVLSLQGTGLGAAFSSSTSAVAFPSVTIHGAGTPANVVLQNNGNVAATPSITLSNSADFQVNLENCAQSVAPGASCSMTVTFAPAHLGALTSNLVFGPTDAAGDTKLVALTGSGLSGANLSLSQGSLNFNTTQFPNAASQCLTVSNNGQSPAQFQSITAEFGTAFQYNAAANCTTPCNLNQGSLGAGKSCQMGILFNPSAPGSYTDLFKVTYGTGDPTEPSSFQVSVSGTQTAPPVPTVSLFANNSGGLIKAATSDQVTISWSSANATQCTVTQNDLAAVYQPRVNSGTVNGTYVGPNMVATSYSYVVGASDPATLRDMTYSITCSGPGGTQTASLEVKRYAFASGGPVQADNLFNTSAQAVQSHNAIASQGSAGCNLATWGTVWADGTAVPSTVNGPFPSACFDPHGVYNGKVWASKSGTP
jgi:hypothetical protein